MGLTLDEINKKIYINLRSEGYSHEQAIKVIPNKIDFDKTPCENHFGINGYYLIGIISLSIILILLLI